jgi:hypothetical protein
MLNILDELRSWQRILSHVSENVPFHIILIFKRVGKGFSRT